ncbi:nucleotidyltransferase family protein [soil metagenome]
MSSSHVAPYVLDDASLHLLRAGVAAGIPGNESHVKLPSVGRIDWAGLQYAATLGKLLSIAQRGFARMGLETPEQFRNAAASYRRETLAANAVNLTTIQHLIRILEEADLPFLIFKGPLQQKMLYGDYFLRPSTDIDVLVAWKDFDRAADCLQRSGYELPQECQTPWWRIFLGEQHFFYPGRASATIDLHHRLQQPGSPAPRHLSAFLTDIQDVPVGKALAPTMSRINTALISSISLTKAFIRLEPAGGYICDLSAALLAMSVEERRALTARAGRQGLTNTLRFAIRCARETLFLPALEGVPSGLPSTRLSGRDLAGMLFTPLDPTLQRPKLRYILWDLSDSSGMGGKAGTYMFEALNKVAAKACHDLYKVSPAPEQATPHP